MKSNARSAPRAWLTVMQVERPITPRGALEEVLKSVQPVYEAVGRDEVQRRVNELSRRECDVFVRILAYKSAKQIALDLNISHRTVEHQWASVLKKMRVDSVQALRALIHHIRLTANAAT
jgi:FixJ family two-component response regulator